MDDHKQTLPPQDQAQPVQSWLPVLPPPIALLEIALLIVLPAMLDLFVPSFPSLNDTQPHFFWLPVLLLSIQYGSVSGLLAAGTAIALSAFLGWPEQEIGENHFSYLLRIWLQPVLWLSAAIILGQFRMRQIELKTQLLRKVETLTQERHAISEYARNLRRRCDELERSIATRADPDARHLLSALGRLQSTDAPLAAAAFRDAARLGFGKCDMSLWVRSGETLRLSDRMEAMDEPGSRATNVEQLAGDHGLYQAVVTQGRNLSVLVPGDERVLAGAGLAAAPIQD
ncbi:MAG: hypothetical protein ACK5JT_18565, partial [Hyphomicrobiaceae bacterium]